MNLINILSLAASFAAVVHASPSLQQRAEQGCTNPGEHRCGLLVQQTKVPPKVTIVNGYCQPITRGGESELFEGDDGWHGVYGTKYGNQRLYFANKFITGIEFQYSGKSYTEKQNCRVIGDGKWQCDFDC